MQRKYLSFLFIQLHTVLKKGERERQCIQSSLKGCKGRRLFKGHHILMESTRNRTPFQSKMVYKWVMGSFPLGQ